jgi:hypothetical protein
MRTQRKIEHPVSYAEFLRAKGMYPLPCPHTHKNPGDVIIGAKGMIVVRKAA